VRILPLHTLRKKDSTKNGWSFPVGVTCRIEEMQLLPIGGEMHLLAPLHIIDAGQLDDDRLTLNQALDIEQRHFTELLDDRDFAFKQIVLIGACNAQIFGANAEACLLALLG